MKDKQVEQILDELFDSEVPTADAEEKRLAIQLASSEFSREFTENIELNKESIKGNSDKARPMANHNISQSIWSFLMSTLNSRAAYGAFASAAVAFIALSVFLMMPPVQKFDVVVDENSTNPPMVKATDQLAIETPNSTPPEPDTPSLGGKVQPNEDAVIASQDSLSSRVEELVVGAASRGEKITIAEAKADRANASAPVPLHEQEESMISLQVQSIQQPVSAAKRKAEFESSRVRQSSDLLYPEARPDDREEYAEFQTNSIHQVSEEPVSTFSIDVDTAAYSLVRNQLNSGYLPKPEMVRAEELINYFSYRYPRPSSKHEPFSTNVSVLDSPWNKDRKLVHIGIQGYDLSAAKTPDSNLVFLLDVSGSMSQANKLPLVKQSMNLLLDTLKPSDTISIVVYAGAAGMVLEPTEVKYKAKVQAALQRLSAGGSTAGGAGIELAYQLAEQHFKENGVNRIILATDGDFNVGMQRNEDLKTLVERQREKGVFLSVLGFGRNNYQDDMMQTLAQNGNGVAAYIDTLNEAKKVLVDEATSTLFSIAKDVKIQVEFNPNTVSEYRLIGYETRHLNREDFNNDKVDAGDIGAGHNVTAIYEITPSNAKSKSVDQPRYANNRTKLSDESAPANEYGFLKVRYKLPNESQSKLIEYAIPKKVTPISGDAQFSIAVAGFAQLLSGGKYLADYDFDKVIEQALAHKGDDAYGYRSEFIQLVRMAKIAQP